MRVRVMLMTALVLAVLAGVGAVAFLVLGRSTPLETAVGFLPESVRRASYTDWTAVAEAVPGRDPDPSWTPREVDIWLEKAFDEELTTTSSLSTSTHPLGAAFGITPLDGEWEVYGQAEDGSVALLRLSDDVDLSALERALEEAGYATPAEGAGSSGVWVASVDQVARLGLTPVQENVAVVESERLLVMSDSPSFVESAVEVVSGDADSLDAVGGVSELASAVGSPTVAVLWAGDFACEDLAMSQADPADADEAAELVDEAGGVHALEGLVMAQRPSGSLEVGMYFASAEDASDDLQPRTDLASGPAPGQGGTFPERFEITSATAEDQLVTLTLSPVADQLLSDLGQGPVLFATC